MFTQDEDILTALERNVPFLTGDIEEKPELNRVTSEVVMMEVVMVDGDGVDCGDEQNGLCFIDHRRPD